jgi:hypothetical protein
MLEHSANDSVSLPFDDHDQYSQIRLLDRSRYGAVLDVLDGLRSDETTLGELASTLERRDRSRQTDEFGSKQRLLTRLHHRYLPRLDSAGFLDYDPASKRVVRAPRQATN